MSSYKRIFMQKMPLEEGGNAGALKDTAADFGVWGMTIPYGVGGEAKNLPSNDWIDEDGTDEFVPEDGLPLKSFEMELGFVFRTTTGAKSVMEGFRNYLTGKDGSGVWMMLYSEYTGIGWQMVRFVSMDTEPTYKNTNVGEVVVFNIRLKVADPVTRVVMNQGGTALVVES